MASEHSSFVCVTIGIQDVTCMCVCICMHLWVHVCGCIYSPLPLTPTTRNYFQVADERYEMEQEKEHRRQAKEQEKEEKKKEKEKKRKEEAYWRNRRKGLKAFKVSKLCIHPYSSQTPQFNEDAVAISMHHILTTKFYIFFCKLYYYQLSHSVQGRYSIPV